MPETTIKETIETPNGAGTEKEKKETQTVDVEKVKSEAVSSYLKSLGLEGEDGDNALKEILKKHREAEDANKTDLQKANDTLSQTTKQLVQEREMRQLAEAKLEALKLGAKPELVDDLVVVAMAKATKDKDVSAVVAEMKQGSTGSVYFVSEPEKGEERKGNKSKNITRKQPTKEEEKGNEKEQENSGSIASRIIANNKPKKASTFWTKN